MKWEFSTQTRIIIHYCFKWLVIRFYLIADIVIIYCRTFLYILFFKLLHQNGRGIDQKCQCWPFGSGFHVGLCWISNYGQCPANHPGFSQKSNIWWICSWIFWWWIHFSCHYLCCVYICQLDCSTHCVKDWTKIHFDR